MGDQELNELSDQELNELSDQELNEPLELTKIKQHSTASFWIVTRLHCTLAIISSMWDGKTMAHSLERLVRLDTESLEVILVGQKVKRIGLDC